jgi:hypothetical protein
MNTQLWISGTTRDGERAAANLAMIARIDRGTESAALSTAREGRLLLAIQVTGSDALERLQELMMALPGRWVRVGPMDSTVGGHGLVNLDQVGRVRISAPRGEVVLEAPDGTLLGTAFGDDALVIRAAASL